MRAYFESNGVINTGRLHSQTIQDRHGTKLKQYIIEKFEWDHHQMSLIDWVMVHKAFSRKTFRQQTKYRRRCTTGTQQWRDYTK